METLKEIVRQLPIRVAVLDLDLRFILANDPFCRAVGYTADELRQRKITEIIYPEETQVNLEWARKLIRGEISSYRIEHRCLTKNRETFCIELTASLLRNSEGVPSHLFMILEDITQKRKSEKAIDESEALLKIVMDTLPVGVWITDREGKIISGNPAGQKVWGGARYVGVEEYGEYKGWWPDTGKRIEAEEWALARAVTKGESSIGEIVDIECFDGTRKTILNSAVPIRDSNQEIIGAVVVNEDITDLRHMQAALRESEERFKKVFEEGPVGIAIVGLDYRFIDANSIFCQIVGYTKEELAHFTFADITYSEDIENDVELARKMFAAEIPNYQIEKRYVTKEGKIIWINLNASVIRDRAGNPLYGLAIIEDITDRKRSEEALKQKTREAEEANRMKSQFVSIVSHELRTPLNAVIGYNSLMRESRFWKNAVKRNEMLDRISYNSQALLDLINVILDLNRMEAGKIMVHPEEVFLSKIVEEAVNNLSIMAGDKGLKILFIDDRSLPPILSDRAKLRQIFINLIANAIKFTDEGSIVVRLVHQPDVKEVCIEIEDTGIGMTEEQLSRVFEPFYQAEPSNTRARGGTGLGLSIVKRLVDLLGGKIEVVSQPEKGSIFTIRLPYLLSTSMVSGDLSDA